MRAPPNYGFITYDDPAAVQNCLANTVSFVWGEELKMCVFDDGFIVAATVLPGELPRRPEAERGGEEDAQQYARAG